MHGHRGVGGLPPLTPEKFNFFDLNFYYKTTQLPIYASDSPPHPTPCQTQRTARPPPPRLFFSGSAHVVSCECGTLINAG